MKALNLEPEILVEDMQKTLMFYQDILGFKIELSFPEEKPVFARIKKDNITITLNNREDFEKDIPSFKSMKMGGTSQIFIKATGVEDFFNEIKNRVKIVQEIHNTNYGTIEFIIEDCNGYFIDFSEDITS